MPKKSVPYSNRELTRHLREIAAEINDELGPNGEPITKGMALACILFHKALGSAKKIVDDEGRVTELREPPQAWAIQLIYDRLEGKVAPQIEENERPMTAEDKVRELVSKQLNVLTESLTGPLPPTFDGVPDAE